MQNIEKIKPLRTYCPKCHSEKKMALNKCVSGFEIVEFYITWWKRREEGRRKFQGNQNSVLNHQYPACTQHTNINTVVK